MRPTDVLGERLLRPRLLWLAVLLAIAYAVLAAAFATTGPLVVLGGLVTVAAGWLIAFAFLRRLNALALVLLLAMTLYVVLVSAWMAKSLSQAGA